MTTVTDFTRTGYAELLTGLTGQGYESTSFAKADPAARHLILRHDVDMSIDAALVVAQAEARLGVRAHYFVLLRTEMYNPWSEAGRAGLNRLRELGHEVGLHFDASLYPDHDAALDAAVAEECAALETIIGAPVTTVSFHRPVRRLQGYPGTVGGRIHAYQPRFFHEMGYCSDSRGAWRHGHPLDHPAVAEGRALQLLTHPIWWARESPLDPVAALDAFRTERDRVLARALAANCDPYREAYGEDPAWPGA